MTDRSGDMTFQANEHRPSGSLLQIGENTGEVFGMSMWEEFSVTVPGCSLDDFFEEHAIESVDLMKVDIQGVERLLVQGGQKALRKVRLLCFALNRSVVRGVLSGVRAVQRAGSAATIHRI